MDVAIYARVSTDSQSVAGQVATLEGVAKRKGWTVVKTYTDNGISGSKGRDQRPALDAMLKDATRRDFDLVMAWSVDRLARSLQDLVNGMAELNAAGVGLYLHQQAVDTTTPSGRALLQMLGVFAEFERALIVARVRNGIEHAKTHGTKSGRPMGRPKVDYAKRKKALALIRGGGMTVREIAAQTGISKSAVARLQQEDKQ